MVDAVTTPAMLPCTEDISDDEEPKPRPHVSKFDAPQTVTIGGQVRQIFRRKSWGAWSGISWGFLALTGKNEGYIKQFANGEGLSIGFLKN